MLYLYRVNYTFKHDYGSCYGFKLIESIDKFGAETEFFLSFDQYHEIDCSSLKILNIRTEEEHFLRANIVKEKYFSKYEKNYLINKNN